MNTTRIEFAPGHEDEPITEQDVAAARRLVDLAPRLLDALRGTLWVLEHPEVNAIKFCGNPKRQAGAIRALIAEAEGRSPQEPA